MQTLEITDEQHAFIQRLRAELSEQVVGKYGHVRDQDAVQFLIDNLDGDLDVDRDVSFTTAAELAEESSDLEEVSYTESEPVEGDSVTEPDEETAPDADEPDEGRAEDASDGSEEEDEGDSATEGPESEDASSGAADDDDMLNRMMNLLDTHDDKWEESDSADYRYSVTLPDGSVEHVQTKDDVRALLFKNY
ncbi:hypothetical protein [Natrononativus amylolyticus]|uniref:hypothetical protein n=1 Tax=Natrononativus amylolyticus TaxID=2963434 RepID=UPI0020CE7C7E|nr:hypothetical protein [Natrononativus amylolyticus]